MQLKRLISMIFHQGIKMKTTCYCRKLKDIVIKNIDDIIIRRNEPTKEDLFVNYAWNGRSVKIIEDYYPKVKSGEMTIAELCRKSGKSYSAVRNKVRRMGFHGEMKYQ